MDAVKTARLVETPEHYDSFLDKAGYAAATVECLINRNKKRGSTCRCYP